MSNKMKFIQRGSSSLFLLGLITIIFLATPSVSFGYGACIEIDVSGDDDSCESTDVAFWRYSGTTTDIFPQLTGGCSDAITIGTSSWPGGRYKYGRLYSKAFCGSTERYRLDTVTAATTENWFYYNAATLKFYSPASGSGSEYYVVGYWGSQEIRVQGSILPTDGAARQTVKLKYVEQADYTVYYDFDNPDDPDDPKAVAPHSSGWQKVGNFIRVEAPDLSAEGWKCVSWTNGRNTFPATGNSCIFEGALLSNKIDANQITWQYKKASYLRTRVSSPGPDEVDALIAPFQNSVRTLTANGSVTVQAQEFVAADAGNRWGLTGSIATGDLGDDTTGLTSRTFPLTGLNPPGETDITWQYEKQASMEVSFSSNVPQSIIDVAGAFPADGTTWHLIDGTIEPTVTVAINDPEAGQWVCIGWTGTGSAAGSGTDCAAVPPVVLDGAGAIRWEYGRRTKMRVDLEGIDIIPPVGDILPAPGDQLFTLNEEETISAKNEILSADKRSRFILEGWVGTGNIPLTGTAVTTEPRTTIGPFVVDQNSTVRWIYRKELAVRVNTNFPQGFSDPGQGDPVECVTADYNNCVDNAEMFPRPYWVKASDGVYPVNYYPQGTQLSVTAKHQVTNGGETVTLTRFTPSVTLPENSGLQIYNGRKAMAFTLNQAVELVWDYSDTETVEVGEAVPAPAGATDDKPQIVITVPDEVTPDQAFYWSTHDKKLYPKREITSAMLTWTGVTGTQEVTVVWPSNPQQHIAGAPANLAPDSTDLNVREIVYSQNNASLVNDEFSANFNANTAGRSVVLFFDGGTDPDHFSPKFIAVDTIDWSSVVTNSVCTIGSTLTNFGHEDPEDLNGFVFNELAFYDGTGPDKAYDRSSRTGPIIPVNFAAISDTQRQMLVIWYETDSNDIGWPVTPVSYDCQWPASPRQIVIASGDGQPPNGTEGRIYYQGDPTLPGHNPNEEHALFLDNKVFALRDDFNMCVTPNACSNASLPYVLLKYRDPSTLDWAIEVFSIARTDGPSTFTRDPVFAGSRVVPFQPLATINALTDPLTDRSALKSGQLWYYNDHNNGHWAKAADQTEAAQNGTSEIVMDWYYPLQDGFYYPDFDGDNTPDKRTGDSIPFLGHDGSTNIPAVPPQEVRYPIVWPSDAPTLRLGETLITSQGDLPPIEKMASLEVLYDESLFAGEGHLVKLFAPLSERRVGLASLPEGLETESKDGKVFFKDVPYYLKSRLFHDPAAGELVFKGTLDTSGLGAPLLLPNVMSTAEKDVLTNLPTFGPMAQYIAALYDLSRNPNGVNLDPSGTVNNPFNSSLPPHSVADWNSTIWGMPLGLEQDNSGDIRSATQVGVTNALTAGTAAGTGFVTLVENDHDSLFLPVEMYVIQVTDEVYPGELKLIESDNVFDEKLTLRHNADFGGEPEKFYMEWYYHPDDTGISPPLPVGDDTSTHGWIPLDHGPGMSEYTIGGANIVTLSDNWIAMRYYYRDVFPTTADGGPVVDNTIPEPLDDSDNWSPWTGAPPGNENAMLAEGWLKRVVDKLNPLDARVRDFQRNETNTLVSMISQAGAYCGGGIALNDSAENLNSVGMISAYQTLLSRGMSLSVDAGHNYGPANVALLNMATRISDLSMLLANEAYADAMDPTIGFTTASGELGSLAPAIFAFQNQVDSSLGEELILMRGRDNTAYSTGVCPLFNRLPWNFTNGDGELAYVQTYNILDQDVSGLIDETDAREMFPQGHGDAWGHYLSAMKPWYRLLTNEHFTWEPRAESVLVAGLPVLVDYLDERKFAAAAAAKARAGVEIIDLTYRSSFVDDADGQWQGYKDSDEDRAWGVDEWSRRVGTGALLDWAMANAMLPPEDLNPEHTGIQKIDRTTVPEVNAIASHFHSAQDQIDKADAGLNPIGLARGTVPFDIDPSFLDVSSTEQGLTHFEQIYGRALKALQNATVVFDYANEFTQSLRHTTDNLQEFKQNLLEQETDYKNRLIEMFGYPYSDDIGPGGIYPEGYDGPDWAHFMIVERSELTGEAPSPINSFVVNFNFNNTDLDPTFGIVPGPLPVPYTASTDGPWIVKDPSWTGSRRATGEIQDALSDYMQAESQFKRTEKELKIAVSSIERGRDTLQRRYDISAANILSVRTGNVEVSDLESQIRVLNGFLLGTKRAQDTSDRIFETIIEGFPVSSGFSNDLTSGGRAAVRASKTIVGSALGVIGDGLEGSILTQEHAINAVNRGGDFELYVNDARYEVAQKVSELSPLMNAAIIKQYETYQQKEAMIQALGRFTAAVAKGERLMSEREMQRKLAAADVQDYRYNDISFRIFRNDALQKYRAQFDMAARYVYLAAMAYDYETNLLGSNFGSGSQFVSEIFRQRTLGKMVDGQPVAGLGGLADVLARLGQNFDLYKTRLGFNNPQRETNRFSLREENFRIRGDASADADWKTELASHLVPNLWDEDDFKRFALPFTTEDLGDQPALVIPFSTTVTFGKNFFGWPLSGGDSAYDPSNFATKVRSVGVWFEGYPLDQLSQTPRVYLVPIGADVLRSPGDDSFSTRQWNIVDQKLPAPFALGASELDDENWIPMNDSLSGDMGDIRRYPSLRAYKYSDAYTTAETTTNSRLIGRSVWNTEWLLIIPGGTLLFDPDTGLDTFLNDVTDIKLFFQTYSYTGE